MINKNKWNTKDRNAYSHLIGRWDMLVVPHIYKYYSEDKENEGEYFGLNINKKLIPEEECPYDYIPLLFESHIFTEDYYELINMIDMLFLKFSIEYNKYIHDDPDIFCRCAPTFIKEFDHFLACTGYIVSFRLSIRIPKQ